MRPADREAFWAELIVQHRKRLHSYINRIPIDGEDRRDLVAAVWAMAVAHEEELVCTSDAWPILHLCLRNVCADRERAKRTDIAAYAVHCESEDRNPKVDVEDTAQPLSDWTLEAMRLLPSAQREALDFRYRWQWPYDVIAVALGLREGTVRVYVKRAKDTLRQWHSFEAKSGGAARPFAHAIEKLSAQRGQARKRN